MMFPGRGDALRVKRTALAPLLLHTPSAPALGTCRENRKSSSTSGFCSQKRCTRQPAPPHTHFSRVVAAWHEHDPLAPRGREFIKARKRFKLAAAVTNNSETTPYDQGPNHAALRH